MSNKGILYLVTLSLLPAMLVAGESLGSAAKREKERCEKNQDGKPVRTVTEEDLKAAREKDNVPRPTPSDETAQGAGALRQPLPIDAAPCCAADDEDGARHVPFARRYGGRSESEWRRRGRAAREKVDKARKRVEKLPFGIDRYDNSTVLNARRELKEAEAELSQLEEEARKAGVPPGWTR